MRARSAITAALLLLSIVLIGLGIDRKEPVEVAQKAMNICLECIGVG